MKTPAEMPLLTELADACNAGACNAGGLIRSLGKAADEIRFGEARDNPAVKVILGHLSYLVGEALGPSPEALEAYEKWRKTVPAVPAVAA